MSTTEITDLTAEVLESLRITLQRSGFAGTVELSPSRVVDVPAGLVVDVYEYGRSEPSAQVTLQIVT